MVVSACPLPGTWQAAAPSLPCHPSVPTGSTAQWGHPLGVLGTELGFELLVGQAVVATSLGCLPSPASSHCHSPRVPPPHRQTPALPCRAPPFCGGNCCWEGRPDGAAGWSGNHDLPRRPERNEGERHTGAPSPIREAPEEQLWRGNPQPRNRVLGCGLSLQNSVESKEPRRK